MNEREVVVIGGGVIGVCITYYLAAAGVPVTLLESGQVGRASSYGNAGLIVPSYSIPMASPAAVVAGLKSLIGRDETIRIGLRPDPAY